MSFLDFLEFVSNFLGNALHTRYFSVDLDWVCWALTTPRKPRWPGVGIPDCVAHLLSKGPKFIIGRRSLPPLHDLDAAMRSFKRQLILNHFFNDHGKTSSASDNFTLRMGWHEDPLYLGTAF